MLVTEAAKILDMMHTAPELGPGEVQWPQRRSVHSAKPGAMSQYRGLGFRVPLNMGN